MNDEPIEIHTAAGIPTGVVKTRAAIHRDGDWHVAAFVWIVSPDARVLLQLRAPHKDVWPGRWDASCAGHVGAGETPLAGAVRELHEELGIVVSPGELLALAPHREEHEHPNRIIDREHHAVFRLRSTRGLAEYAPGEEVTRLGLASLAELVALVEGGRREVMLETLAGPIAITSEDIVPYDAAYWRRLVGE